MSYELEIVVNPYGDRPYSLDRPRGWTGLIVKGKWSEEICDFIEKNKVEALYLNISRGWETKDYSFLSELTLIKELNIIDSTVRNLSAVEKMSNLREISLTCHTKDKINLAKLHKLERCFLGWWPGASSIFECTSLESLYIDEVKLKDCSKLGALTKLKFLTIGNSTIESIEWLPKLQKLIQFCAYNCRKLADFSPISACAQLRRLAISGSKELDDLSFVSPLINLEWLDISDNGEMASLAPLGALRNLKALTFSGRNTLIRDGDLSVLETLPKLSMLMFAGRRHYTHKLIKRWNWENFDHPDKLLQRK